MGRVLSIYRQEMDGYNPLQIDIKVPILAPTFDLNSKYYSSLNGKLNFSNQNTKKDEK